MKKFISFIVLTATIVMAVTAAGAEKAYAFEDSRITGLDEEVTALQEEYLLVLEELVGGKKVVYQSVKPFCGKLLWTVTFMEADGFEYKDYMILEEEEVHLVRLALKAVSRKI